MRDVDKEATVNPSHLAEHHIQQYLASEGRDVDHPAADRLILLYTTGRRTGAIRRVPLGSFPEGDSLFVIGSNSGRPYHPEWYLNLQADHKVWVRRKDDLFEAMATTLGADERQQFWKRLTARVPVFAEFQAKAGRQLPVVRLTPIGADRTPP